MLLPAFKLLSAIGNRRACLLLLSGSSFQLPPLAQLHHLGRLLLFFEAQRRAIVLVSSSAMDTQGGPSSVSRQSFSRRRHSTFERHLSRGCIGILACRRSGWTVKLPTLGMSAPSLCLLFRLFRECHLVRQNQCRADLKSFELEVC